MMTASARPRPHRPERAIEDTIIKHPERLGFPGALAIRSCRVAEFAGTVDVMLLPRSGPVKLVLVEAKVATARDAASKVIGQVLMYYAGALQLGSEGLRLMRRFARDHPESAHAWGVKSPKRISGGVSPPPAAWRRIYEGTKLTPDQIRIFIAIDAEPHRALRPTLLALRRHHGVRIGLIRVTGGRVRELSLRRGDVHAP